MVNLDQILQDLIQLIKRTGIEVDEHSGHDLFARFAEFLHAFQGWVHATFMPGESASGTAWPYDNSMLNRPDVNEIVNQSPEQLKSMDLGNNIWLGNIFGWS
ncbi:hypothetical protein DTO063F5_5443 [Paecilomyces variotii]|nr:hypothetical protein DTO063F5_5443 [Paecilomyces variotii]